MEREGGRVVLEREEGSGVRVVGREREGDSEGEAGRGGGGGGGGG